ncbi:MAG TPA: cation:proton antiporter [Candidatus Saccharimonadales bacterium]|nr:cation:proton antiporter [Candidatus Saccharimonadales bacterium]
MNPADALLALGIVIALAAFFGAWATFFRLPLIIAYILTGLILGPFLFKSSADTSFALMRDLGLSFLLFLVGLEIKTSEFKEFSGKALIAGFLQIFGTAFVGYFLAILLGFSALASFYIAAALAFSSTVIVVKILSEKRDLDSLYGKLTVAILLLQDLAAIILLILLPALGSKGDFNVSSFFITIAVGSILVSLIYLLSRKVLPYLFERVAVNLELLFLTSIAWVLLIAAISAKLNFSLEIGAFLAGLGLASLKQEHQIAARVRPLRDFFIVIFFIILGSQIVVTFQFKILFEALLLSAFVLMIKPLIVLVSLARLGFKRRTAFLSGVSLAQISEFSLIILFLAYKQHVVSSETVSVLTLTALITFGVSSYLLVYATKIYRSVEKYLRFVEVKEVFAEKNVKTELEDHVVLIGCDRLGWEVLKQLKKQGKKVLVVDFNPTIINSLKEAQVDFLFGDVTDPEIWEEANIEKAVLIISTIFDPDDTEELLHNLKDSGSKPIVFVTAAEREWAVKFYRHGADYVIVPRVLSGHQVAHLLTAQKLSAIREGEMKKDHLEELHASLEKINL